MATKKQKQELIDTLKFTPIKARIMISGYGGECYIGRVTREQYEFYKKHKIDLDQYATDWDDDGKWDFIPNDMRIFPPGSPYECDDLCHASGATMDDSSFITVEDENGNIIWESNLDVTNLANKGVDVVGSGDWESAGEPEGTVVFWGGQGEKGCFFDGEIILRKPFDPNKLTIFYEAADGWDISGGVEYDDEEIEGTDGYSTTGKWSEYKFHIIGDEEVYEGVERDEDGNIEEDEDPDYEHPEANFDWDPEEELDKIRLPAVRWAPKGEKPPCAGEYDVLIDASWPIGGPGRAEWTGKTWKSDGKKVKVEQWAYPEEDELDIPVLENEETWASRVIDEETFNGIPYSPWFTNGETPARKGEYEVFEESSSWPFPFMAKWTGREWKVNKEAIKVRQWRGLSQPAS